MIKCTECGVFIEDADVCPLCGEPVDPSARASVDPRPGAAEPRGDEPPTAGAQVVKNAKRWLVQMVSLVAFTAGLVIFASDFGFGFGVNWSVIPLVSIAFVWLAAISAIGLARRFGLLLTAQTLILGAFLFGLSRLAEVGAWFGPLALPITVMVGVLVGAGWLAATRLRLSRLQSLAVAILCAGFFVVGLEAAINRYLGLETPVSWSLVAFACSVSLFFLILFINRQLRERHAEYRRIFHL